MKKRIVSFCLLTAILVGLLVFPVQAASPTQTEMLQVLAVLGVMNGDPSGDLRLSSPVTRAEFSKMAITASAYRDMGRETAGISPFSDVSHRHWAAGYITTARNAGWLTGYLDGSFRPDQTVTLAEALTVTLKMLGYTDADFTGTWPSGQMTLYRSLRLDRNITASASKALTRLECAWLLYNCLGSTTRTGTAYGPTAGCPVDSTGEPDYLALISKELEGPYLVQDKTWQTHLGFTPKTVYRNDALSVSEEIQTYDILYGCKAISTVYAYANRHTGTLDAVTPSRAHPTAVVLSGVTYPLGSSSASYSVSSLGQFQLGDTITLLMGRDSQVAAIISASDLAQATCGVVTAAGTQIYTAADGSSYTAEYAEVLTAEGATHRYRTKKELEPGDLVEIRFEGGSTSVQLCSPNSAISGNINAAGTQLGVHLLSDSVSILDVLDTTGRTIPTQRLAGARLSADDILFALRNNQGVITHLLLDDYTGDLHSYGIILDANVFSYGTTLASSYEFLIRGKTMPYGSTSKAFTSETGPAQITISGTDVTRAAPLSSVKALRLSETTLIAEDGSYTLAGDVQVYLTDINRSYQLTSLQAISDLSHYTVTGYYDNRDADGGRIRILVARES